MYWVTPLSAHQSYLVRKLLVNSRTGTSIIFTSFVALVPHAEDVAYVPAPDDSLWLHGHNPASSRASHFSRRVADPSSEILVGSAAVFTLRPDMAPVLQEPPREPL